MTEFKKIQKNIPPERQRSRQHAIPLEIRQYAGAEQLKFTGDRGRGRENVPSLCDIYQALTIEGMELVELAQEKKRTDLVVFQEIGRPANCLMARIRFDSDFDEKLRDLKRRADAGEFEIQPSGDVRRNIKQISLISLAVNLMKLAIAKRQKTMSFDKEVIKQSAI